MAFAFELMLLLWLSFQLTFLTALSVASIAFKVHSAGNSGSDNTIVATLWFDSTIYQVQFTASQPGKEYTFNNPSIIGQCTGDLNTQIMIENDDTDAIEFDWIKFSTTSNVWYGIDAYCVTGAVAAKYLDGGSYYDDYNHWILSQPACPSQYALDHTCTDTDNCPPSKQIFYFDTTKPNQYITYAGYATGAYTVPQETTCTPTGMPTNVPITAFPTTAPTNVPTVFPSNIPTSVPSNIPTTIPTILPSDIPSNVPIIHPTNGPTIPSQLSAHSPTNMPTTEEAIQGTGRLSASTSGVTDSNDSNKNEGKEGLNATLLSLLIGIALTVIIIVMIVIICCVMKSSPRKQAMKTKHVKTINEPRDLKTKHLDRATSHSMVSYEEEVHNVTANGCECGDRLHNDVELGINTLGEGEAHHQPPPPPPPPNNSSGIDFVHDASKDEVIVGDDETDIGTVQLRNN
eukprot:253962_1